MELRAIGGGAGGTQSGMAVHGEGLCFGFGSSAEDAVLRDLDIAVERGVIYGLLGPSGCGKTTLLRCIVGRHKPSSGVIKIFGKTPGQPGFSVPGPGVGFMPQELALYPEITTEETLTYFGRLYQMNRLQIKEGIAFLTGLLDIPDKKKQIKYLSGGQQRRVSFAIALIHKPPLIILDEPTVGVDPLLRRGIWNHLQNLAARHSTTIIITTHYVEEAREAQAVGLMRDGRLLAETNPEALILHHGVSTLEDVFLKLCVKDSEAIDVANCDPNALMEEGTTDVWISRKNGNHKSSINTVPNEHHRTALLGHSREIEEEKIKDPDFKTSFSNAMDRMAALTKKNFVRQKRNIPLVFFQLFVPAFQVIVFCLCVGGEPFDLPMAVVDQETVLGGKSKDFLRAIDSRTIKQNNFSDFESAVDSVKRGENWGVILINPFFTSNLIERYLAGIDATNETIWNSTIRMYLDMTNQQISSTIYSKIMTGFVEFSEKLLQDFGFNTMLSSPPVVLGDAIYGDNVPNFTEFMAPGMILGITYIMAVGLSAMSIIIEKKEGLLDRSWVAGVRSWEVIFSLLFTLFVVMLFQVALVLLFTFLAFSIPSRGPLLWVVVAVLLVGLEGMSYGLFISSIVNDENIAVMIAMGSFYPNLLLSGIIWPVEAMPYFLRQFSYCLPLTLISNTMRSILSRGWTITDNGIWDGYLVAIAWIIPVILVSSLFFKYKH